MKAELVQDVHNVRGGGALGDGQSRGNLPIREALRYQRGHLPLAARQQATAGTRPAHRLSEGRGSQWCHRALALADGGDDDTTGDAQAGGKLVIGAHRLCETATDGAVLVRPLGDDGKAS